MIIQPTVGRVVYFYPPGFNAETDQPLAAIIAHVWSDTCVNLAIFDANGRPYPSPPTSVLLVQEGNPVPTGGNYAAWMPFQLTMAKQAAAGGGAGNGAEDKQHNPADDLPKQPVPGAKQHDPAGDGVKVPAGK